MYWLIDTNAKKIYRIVTFRDENAVIILNEQTGRLTVVGLNPDYHKVIYAETKMQVLEKLIEYV